MAPWVPSSPLIPAVLLTRLRRQRSHQTGLHQIAVILGCDGRPDGQRQLYFCVSKFYEWKHPSTFSGKLFKRSDHLLAVQTPLA